MYAALRQARAKPGVAEELAQRIREGAVPIVSGVAGFRAYYVVFAPDDTVTTISIFDNHAAANESNQRVMQWVDESLMPLLAGPVSAVSGPVIVHSSE